MLIGVLIGAAIGFFFFGAVGLLLGGVLGLWAAKIIPMVLLKGQLGKIRAQYLNATFAVMGALCKADGQISENEIAVAERMFQQMNMNDDQRAQARAAFKRGKQEDFDLDAEVAAVARLCHGQRALQQMFLQVQIAAIAADGQMHAAERDLLLHVARGLGLSAAELQQIEAMLGMHQSRHGDALGGQTSSSDGLEQAYALLDLDSDASDAEVKKAYRRQMSRNHPDKLAARGMPDNMRAMAEEKTRKIGAAYERIRGARGLA